MDVPQHASILPAWLIQAYRATNYEVHGQLPFVLRVDQPSEALRREMLLGGVEGALYITAWNPQGVELATQDNDARNARLTLDLRARELYWFPAFGAHPADRARGEASLLVFGPDRDTACELGWRHEQNAVLWAGADAVPRLLLLR